MSDQDYKHRVLQKHYMTPSRFMDLMQEQVAIKDVKDIGGSVGYMLRQNPQPEYVPNSYPETLDTYDQAKIETRAKAILKDAKLNGFIAEYGVHKGRGFIEMCKIVDQKVYGFDAFEGLDDGGKWTGNIGHQDMFQNGGKPNFPIPDNGVIKVGWFKDTLPGYQYSHQQARFINLDCDNYEASKTVLENIKQYIVPGTVIALDDYFNQYNYKMNSQFTAWEEFVDANNIRYDYLYCVAPAVIVKVVDK